VKLVIGPEGTDVTVWLQRGEGAFSHHHSEVAAETRANLVKLKGLHRDGVLDEKAYRAAVEMWVVLHCPRLLIFHVCETTIKN
jgi:hypothetical protein